MISTVRPIPDDPRRKRQHQVRRAFKRFGWRELAHRHRRRTWRGALRKFRGKWST